MKKKQQRGTKPTEHPIEAFLEKAALLGVRKLSLASFNSSTGDIAGLEVEFMDIAPVQASAREQAGKPSKKLPKIEALDSDTRSEIADLQQMIEDPGAFEARMIEGELES